MMKKNVVGILFTKTILECTNVIITYEQLHD